MSVLAGPRKEVRHVIKDGTAYWTTFRDGRIHFADGRSCDESEVVHRMVAQAEELIVGYLRQVVR